MAGAGVAMLNEPYNLALDCIPTLILTICLTMCCILVQCTIVTVGFVLHI